MKFTSVDLRAGAFLLSAIAGAGCASDGADDWVVVMPEALADATAIQLVGTVHHMDPEGGLYVIRGTDGTNYNRTNLPEAFRLDGTPVEAEARRRDDMASIGMVGPLVEIIRIRRRAAGDDAAAGGGSVTGTLSYRERVALPADAEIEVQLLDVSRQDAGAPVVSSTTFRAEGRQVPLPFEVTYDPGEIDDSRAYGVRAVIRSNDRLMFTTDSHVPVITRGNPASVQLRLVGAAADDPSGGAGGLVGTAWRLEDLAGAGVLDRVQATLEFPEAGRVAGSGSCNRVFGKVEVDGESISFGELGSTRRSCGEATNNQETEYMRALANAERFRIQEPFLYVYGAAEEKPLRFIRADD